MYKYAVVDLETNGQANRITEIAIIVFENGKISQTYESLVNPGGRIPSFITALTGITQEMLWDQPNFRDIAEHVEEILEGCVFVAHNVSFDYNILKSEFENVGRGFKHPKLCSVRLSRKLLPGHKSYSLGNICSALGIQNQSRHRAYGDALATVELLQHLQRQEDYDQVIATFLHQHSKEATLPSHLDKTEFENLPSQPGIYKFYNQQRDLIYVGKAKDIKKRVLGHFYTKTTQKVSMLREIAHVDYDLSGTELIALLMEDALIKRKFPKYNKASKQRITGYALVVYSDRAGIQHLGMQTLKNAVQPIKTFFSPIEARMYVEALMTEFNLCAKYCHLIENNSSCEESIFSTCLGICKGSEEVEVYNNRVEAALTKVLNDLPNGWIKQKGRSLDEDAFIRIKNGKYCGYGFIDKSLSLQSHDFDDFLISEMDNMNVQKILMNVHHLIKS